MSTYIYSLLILLSISAGAQVPGIITYQGRLASNGTNFGGEGRFKFAFLNAANGASLWSNDGTSANGGEPIQWVPLTVTNGLFTALLGDVALPNMTVISVTTFTNLDVRLRIWFSDGATSFAALIPDQRITAVGYAMRAAGVADGTITGASLADGAVTTSKLADGVVNSIKLAPFIDLGDRDTPGRLRLFHTSLGNPAIVLQGTNGSIALNGPDGVAQVELEPSLTGGHLNLQDAIGHETTMALAGGFNSGGTFSLFSGTGGLRADMISPIAGGRMSLYNSSATRRLELSGELGTADVLGSFNLLDAFGGNVIGTMFRQSNGGQVQVSNGGVLAGHLGASLSGGGFLQVYNGDGNIGVRVDGHNGNAGMVQVNNTQGSVSVRLDGHDGNSGLIQVYDTNINLRMALDGLGATGFAEFSLYSSTGVTNLQLSSGDAGGFLSVNQANGTRGVFLDGDAASNDGGTMTIYQGDGQIGLFLDGDSGGAALIQARGTNAATRVSIDGGGDYGGGQITLFENDGSETIRIGQELTSGGGHVLLRNQEETLTVSIAGGTADGDGYEGGRMIIYGSGGPGDRRAELSGESQFQGGFLTLWAHHDLSANNVHLSADGTSWIRGQLGVDRVPSVNALEVNGAASKTTAGSWLANSDLRIKTQVKTITNALQTLSRIRAVGFRYTEEYRKAHSSLTDSEYFNVIAQEFAEIFPNSVTESGDKLPNGERILQVDTYPATIHAIAAIQELHGVVKEKDERITNLESRNRSLEARLERLEQMLIGPALRKASR